MGWKNTVNRALSRTVGYELRRLDAPAPASAPAKQRKRAVGRVGKGDRLVQSPVFVLCTLRSGSTLLRVLLDSHSQLCAPHEIHLRYISVNLDQKWSERSLKEMGLDQRGLEHLLWDRILHRELAGSGKQQVIDKTPNNVFMVDRLKECWPDARFIFLLRHPGAIARSRMDMNQKVTPEQNADLIRRYCEAIEDARERYDGITVRYEDVTTDPERETRRLCEFLGVPWEQQMLEYGKFDHGRFKSGLGDFKDKIKTGEVQAADQPPARDEIHPDLIAMCERWGYLEPTAASAATPPSASPTPPPAA